MASSQLQDAFPSGLAHRLDELAGATGDAKLRALSEEFCELEERSARKRARSDSDEADPSGDGATETQVVDRNVIEAFRDKLSTRLMDNYRASASPLAFGLLYETNYRLFLTVISARLRKFYYFPLDPQDVLQEVFFNIYRYPHKFKADRDQAFRHWASMIIRNTVYKATREKDREICHELQDEEIETRPDRAGLTPLGDAIREESRTFCSNAYLIFLRLYMAAYQQLSEREKKALHMVEVLGEPYKNAATALEIRLENLKMVIFRARKKILRMLDHALASAKTWQAQREADERAQRPGTDSSTIKCPQNPRLRSNENPLAIPRIRRDTVSSVGDRQRRAGPLSRGDQQRANGVRIDASESSAPHDPARANRAISDHTVSE